MIEQIELGIIILLLLGNYIPRSKKVTISEPVIKTDPKEVQWVVRRGGADGPIHCVRPEGHYDLLEFKMNPEFYVSKE